MASVSGAAASGLYRWRSMETNRGPVGANYTWIFINIELTVMSSEQVGRDTWITKFFVVFREAKEDSC